MQHSSFSIKDLLSAFTDAAGGLFGIILGYFLPIRDIAYWLFIAFVIDMICGYWAAKKIDHERFSPKKVWNTTVMYMLAAIIIISLLYSWDKTFHQDTVPTYMLVGYAFGGLLIASIAKNLYKITNWSPLKMVKNVVTNLVKEKSGVEIPDEA